jgi:phosphoribosylanthranilate isomerase
MKLKIKVCGIRRLLDVLMVECRGVDLLGFINVERSQRFVDKNLIKLLTSHMDDPDKAVMIMEPDSPDEVIKMAKTCGINKLQLHSLSPSDINYIKSVSEFEVTRAVGVGEKISKDKMEEIKAFALVCDSLLLDYEMNGKSGGTGVQIPLTTAVEGAEIAKKSADIDIFLAGGINARIMKEEKQIIAKHFQGVDVNSGVEESPGVKDLAKLEEFMEIVNN